MDWTWGWAAVLVALIAAAVAGWQAFEARKSRIDASAAQHAAEEAAKTAAAAQAQSADSLSAIAEIVKAQHEAAQAAAAKKPDPWRLEPGRSVNTGTARLLILGGDEAAEDVEVTVRNEPQMLHLTPNPVPTTWQPGDALEVYWFGRSDGLPVLEVRWKRPGDTAHTTTRATLR
jgi:hypothetical protein